MISILDSNPPNNIGHAKNMHDEIVKSNTAHIAFLIKHYFMEPAEGVRALATWELPMVLATEDSCFYDVDIKNCLEVRNKLVIGKKLFSDRRYSNLFAYVIQTLGLQLNYSDFLEKE